MTVTTRLNSADRQNTVESLHGVLSNIVRFVEMPVRDRHKMVNLWHGQFPRELFEAMDVLKKLGYGPSHSGSPNYRVAMEIEGEVYTALIRTEELPFEGEVPMEPMRMSPNISNATTRVVGHAPSSYRATVLHLEYVEKHLGAADTAAFVEWMIHTAKLREEILDAATVITDIFDMAKTAGQIKRMVPDLLQYLPASLRQAYDEQKRASTMPFEWAPYDKGRVERMILAVSKGHLLANMAKPGRENFSFGTLDAIMWARQTAWVGDK